MPHMPIKIKKLHPDAVSPKYATNGAACFDLFALPDVAPDAHACDSAAIILRTGLAFEIPKGWAMLIYSRSGHGFRRGLRLSNCVGVIDSDYRGEVKVSLRNDGDFSQAKADVRRSAIAQAMLVPVQRVGFIEVDELDETARGNGGFGSTDKENPDVEFNRTFSDMGACCGLDYSASSKDTI